MYYDKNSKCIEDYIELRPTATKEDIEDLIDSEIADDVWSEMCEVNEFYEYFDWDPSTAYGMEMDIDFINSDSKEEFLNYLKVTEDYVKNAEA